jgi:hypothetical protein
MKRYLQSQPDVSHLFDFQRTPEGHTIEKRHDVVVSHPNATVGDGSPDQIFFVRSMDVDKSAKRVYTATSVDPAFQALKPKNSGEHPVRFWKASADPIVEYFARPSAPAKNRPRRVASADFQADAMRTVRGLQRLLGAPESACRRRHRKAKHLAGGQETDEFLAGYVQVQALDLGHGGVLR